MTKETGDGQRCTSRTVSISFPISRKQQMALLQVQRWLSELTDQPAADGCSTFTFPLSTFSGITDIWPSETTHLDFFLLSLAVWIHQLFTSPSLSVSSPALTPPHWLCHFCDKQILSAGVKNVSLVAARMGLLSAAAAAHRSWAEMFILTSALVWSNNEHRQHPALVFTPPGGLV